MKLSDYLISLIRTGVPVLVGSVLGWLSGVTWLHDLIQNLGLDQRVGITTAVTAGLIWVYYAALRKLEPRFPWLGKLLGYSVASLQYGKLPATPSPVAPPVVPPASPTPGV